MRSWLSPTLVETLGEIIDGAIALTGADFGNIQLLDSEGRLRIVAQRNFPEWWITYWETEAHGQGACGVALARSQHVVIEHVEQSPIFAGTPALDIQRLAGVRAVHSIPLLGKRTQDLGVLSTHYRACHTPSPHELGVLKLLAAHASTLVEHARDEQLLGDSQARLREMLTLLDAVTAGTDTLIATIDREFHYTYFNSRHHEELGRLTGKNTVLGMSLLEVLSDLPDERERVLAIWRRALDGETVVQQMMFGDPNRYRRWYSTRHSPIRDADGTIVGAGEVSTDVTKQVLAEQALQVKEDELTAQRTLINNALHTTDIMLALLDVGFNYVWTNSAYSKIHGVTPEGMVSRNLFALFPTAEKEAIIFRQVRDTETSASYKDYPFEFPDQPERGITYWDWSLSPVKNARGILTGLVLSLRETTQHKRIEMALASSEQRYRSLVEQVPDGIFVADAHGRYLDVNQAGATMLGYSRDEVLGMNIEDIVLPREIECIPEEIARHIGGSVVRSEWRFRRKDGSSFYGEVHGRQLPDGRLQGVLRDVSERRQLENGRLEALSRQRDALVQEVHHRIKNHLHGVIGLLTAEATTNPAISAPLAEAIAQIKAIAAVYGLQAIQSQAPIDLEQMVGLIVKSAAGPVPIKYRYCGPAVAVAEVLAVPLALTVSELILNAVKHLERPDPRRPVSVSIDHVGSAVRLEVRGGPAHLPDGFDFEQQNKIGLGLELVGTLLPKPGAHLIYEQLQDEVRAALWLEAPAIYMS